jgi:hypothetical protein
MALDFKFDPVTKDLIDAADGSFEQTSTAETAVTLQLEQHQGEWWGDPDAGSLLHDRGAFQAAPETLIPDECQRAMALLVSRGRIANVEARTVLEANGRAVTQTRFRDVSTGQLVDTFVRGGG